MNIEHDTTQEIDAKLEQFIQWFDKPGDYKGLQGIYTTMMSQPDADFETVFATVNDAMHYLEVRQK